MEWITLPLIMMSQDGIWVESSSNTQCLGLAKFVMALCGLSDVSACWVLGKCHTFSGVLSQKEVNLCTTFWVGWQAANMSQLMELHYHRLASNDMN